MDGFLYLVGILLIFASIVVSLIYNTYGIIIFLVIFPLGCINIGISKIIEILQEIKNNSLK